MKTRCPWAGDDPLYVSYHDREWGVALHDDRKFFEFLVLEGAQAGLSWLTVLKKRENYRKAFDGFDPLKISRYGPQRIDRLMGNAGIIRNRRKIEATVSNAGAFLRVQKIFGSFDAYIWRFVDGRPVVNRRKELSEIPPFTDVSTAMSRDLKRRGFTFVGPTICYAFMQATGMVNDHLVGCHRFDEIRRATA